jgi:23S rRNA (guanine745-N1)-methyltransferase
VPVGYTVLLPCQQDIHALFQMTPYCWRTPRKGREALAALDRLETEVAFEIHIFRREAAIGH